jgi:thiol-disulfide isomerase/thioredoxin
MKRLLVLLIALGAAVGCELRPPSAGKTMPGATPSMGESLPAKAPLDASPVYLQGGQGGFALSSLKGRVVLLDVCAPWSAASRALVPELNRLHEELQAAGLTVVGLVVDAQSGTGPSDDWQAMGARYSLVAAPRDSLNRLAPVRSVPARLLFDRKGQLNKQYPGDVSLETLRADLAALMKE